jgi:hypothetical protein
MLLFWIYVHSRTAQRVVSDSSCYQVQSQLNRDHHYEVDLTAYTCTCLDFPLIKFCKHLSAIQTHFPEQVQPKLVTKPSLSTDASDIPILATGSTSDTQFSVPASITHMEAPRLAEKLELLATRLRHSAVALPDLVSALEPELDDALNLTANVKLLPPSQKIPPNIKSWTETAKVMMPGKKKKRKRGGDSAYGAGEQSGKKVKQNLVKGNGYAQMP